MSADPKSVFEDALAATLRHEGGYSNDPADKGGPTNLGITLDTLRHALGGKADINHDGVIDAADVRILPRATAAGIYRLVYWDRPGIGGIRDRWLAMKAFDLAVNCGPKVAIVLLQRAIDHAKPAAVAPVKDDGDLGPKTLAALDACDPALVLGAYCSEQASFYLRIIERDPSQARFKAGWLNRARWPLREFGDLAEPFHRAAVLRGEWPHLFTSDVTAAPTPGATSSTAKEIA